MRGTITAALILVMAWTSSSAAKSVHHTNRELAAIKRALIGYHREYGSYPQGDSVRILKELRGDNPKKIVFLKEPIPEDADAWGNPFRLTLSTNGTIHVSSSGPDGRFETEDDISD